MWVRRRTDLVCRWGSEGLLIGLPAQQKWLQTSTGLMALLAEAGTWIEAEKLAATVSAEDQADAQEAVRQLVSIGLLDRADSDSPDEYESPADRGTWKHWGSVARRFHTDSTDADYLVDSAERIDAVVDIVAEGPAPALFKEYPGCPVVPLPHIPVPLRASIDEIFSKRRTHRRFADVAIPAQTLATVLRHTFGTQGFIDAGPFGVQQIRVSPSAGSRHEAECYVVVFNVDGIAPGLYHYSPRAHGLELLDPNVDRARIAGLVYNQSPSYEGAFTCLTTAVVSRLSFKYRHPRAYRLWMYDAGHYGQTFALTCTSLGIGPFQTIAFHDSGIADLLDVDPDEEFVTYLLAAGVPENGQVDLPVDLRPVSKVEPAVSLHSFRDSSAV
jgi:SagB-type dehydrogenase family enzyme